MTNADRIRAMNDEELAMFLERFEVCHHCAEDEKLGCDLACEFHCLEWLKKPAEMPKEE